MVLYARDVLTGELPGPYNDQDAERFAHQALAGTDVLHHPPQADDAQAAELFDLPHDALYEALADELEGSPTRGDDRSQRPCLGRRRRRPPRSTA